MLDPDYEKTSMMCALFHDLEDVSLCSTASQPAWAHPLNSGSWVGQAYWQERTGWLPQGIPRVWCCWYHIAISISIITTTPHHISYFFGYISNPQPNSSYSLHLCFWPAARKVALQTQKFTTFSNKLVDIISNSTQSILNQCKTEEEFSALSLWFNTS